MSTSSRISPMMYMEDDELETTTTMRSSSTQEDNNKNGSDDVERNEKEANPIESWLPITESRNGNVWSCVFHLVSSGIGMQTLMLPLAFATLGWAWAITLFLLGFAWQLYTRWLLIHLHESESGVRYSRFLQLAMVAFGPKLGKWLCMLPVMYLSSAQCTILVVTTGYNLRFLYELICLANSNCSKPLTTAQWFLIFACFAVLLLQHPNLNSLTWVSLFGTIITLLLFSLIWTTSIAKGKVTNDITYDPTYEESISKLTRFLATSLGMEFIAISFRGHNLVLEIQGTLPTSSKHPSHKTMWKASKIAYVLICLCMYPVAVGGHWAYGNKATKKGLVNTFWEYLKDSTSSTTILGLIMIFIIVKELCAYQIYAMPSVDNFEFKYVMKKNQPCPFWLRRVLRVVFVSMNLFFAYALPFLPILSPVSGVFNLSVTFVYPCFMWNAIKKPKVSEPMFWLNLGLGCLGIFMCLLFLIVSIWNLSRDGLTPNFFRP